MSENETKVRMALEKWARSASARIEAADAFDALLAEHRAEVKTLTVELGEVREELGRLSHSDTRKGILLLTARDAALEAAAGRYDTRAATLRADADDASNEKLRLELSEYAEQWESEARAIRALKSQPAERYLRASDVREVLSSVRDFPSALATPLAARKWACEESARRLGVDLDAEGNGGEFDSDVDGKGRAVMPAFPAAEDTRQTCTCTGTCRGPEGLGAGQKCALGKVSP